MIGTTAEPNREQIEYAGQICKPVGYPKGYRVILFDAVMRDGQRYGILRSKNSYLCFPVEDVTLDRNEKVRYCECGGRLKTIATRSNPYGKKRTKVCAWCGKKVVTAVTGEGENMREVTIG